MVVVGIPPPVAAGDQHTMAYRLLVGMYSSFCSISACVHATVDSASDGFEL